MFRKKKDKKYLIKITFTDGKEKVYQIEGWSCDGRFLYIDTLKGVIVDEDNNKIGENVSFGINIDIVNNFAVAGIIDDRKENQKNNVD